MPGLDARIDAAIAWIVRNQIGDGDGGAGWGWVPDVPPNPQNTAEVVCALTALGHDVPRPAEVTRLVRRAIVPRGEGRDWPFQAPIDLAWKLRALDCLGVEETDPDAVACRQALVAEQDAETGGWRMSSRVGPVSITATSVAVEALARPARADEAAARSVRAGVGFLVSATIDRDPRVEPLYACAHIVAALARPEIAALGGKRYERTRTIAVGRLLDGLRRGEARIEEEAFRRGDLSDTWRHLTLHLAVGAVGGADAASLFDPAVRQALSELLELQETAELHFHRGGFRTSSSGFVTSYATT